MSYQKYASHLLLYLKKNASGGMLQMGRGIHQSGEGAISVDEIDYATQRASFLIYGSKVYVVEINNFLKDYGPVTSCSCPSQWGKLCKHRVAAILTLVDVINHSDGSTIKKNLKGKLKKRSSDEPILLKGFEQLTKEKIYDLCDEDELRQVPSRYTADIKSEGLGFITFAFKLNYWNDEESIHFQYTDNTLQSTCTCTRKTYGLCRHQIAVLNYLLSRKKTNYFSIINPNNYAEEKQQLAKWAEIPLDEFDENFTFDFNKKTFYPKGKLSGLINFDKAKSIHFSSQEDQSWQLPAQVLLQEEGDIYTMGYVMDIPYKPDNYARIIPIIGKKTSGPFQKSIKHYDIIQNEPIDITKQDELLITLLELAQKKAGNYLQFTEGTDSKSQFHAVKAAFLLLAKQPNLYIRKQKLHEKVRKMDLKTIETSETPAKLFFEFSEDDEFITLKAKLNIGKKSITIPTERTHRTLISAFLIKHQGVLYCHDNYGQVLSIVESIAKQPLYRAKKRDIELFFERIFPAINKAFPIKIGRLKTFQKDTVLLEAVEKEIYISDIGNYVIFEPAIKYHNGESIKINQNNQAISRNGNTITTLLKDEDAERSLTDFIVSIHPDFEAQSSQNQFFLNYNQLLQEDWFFDFFEKAKNANIKVFGVNTLKRLKYSLHRASFSTTIKSGQDWFDLSIELSFGDEKVKLADLRRAILKNSKYVQLSDGTLGLLPEEWIQKLGAYFRVGQLDGDELKISKRKFSIIDQLFEDIDDAEIIAELAERRNKLKRFKDINKVEISPNITAELRPYQKEGINWLNFLDEFKWGGILADDMGLGKTVQVLSLLQHSVDKKRGPHLVIVPTTLLFNWQAEIKKFAPKLNFFLHYGPDRIKDLSEIKKHDVIITSYGIVMRDISFLQTQLFEYIILDESQAIKNVLSQRYKAVCLLQAKNRLAMTGTPIENNTFDLYAQMNFLNPGFLGSQAGFKRDYSKPIDTQHNIERAKELQKLINPFVLRRTKEQVAKELPPKIEDYIYVNLGPEQQKVYDAYRNKYRDYLLGKIKSDGLNKSKMYVLEGLTKLRLICDSPALISGENFINESAKIQELLKHITEKTAKHKMLVFSQFTKMLALVKEELDKQNITYEYLDGKCSQKQRQQSVENFQTNTDIKVFLISLKAGNTGLNLTAADYVYLLDPWWNPAVEAQAIDRTHRIGQDKHVIAYRMIAKNTIEEKILKLQKRKKQIAADLIHTDESVMKSITQEDIMDLFG